MLRAPAVSALVPQDSLRDAVEQAPQQFSVAKSGFVFGTEECLEAICKDWAVPEEAPSREQAVEVAA